MNHDRPSRRNFIIKGATILGTSVIGGLLVGNAFAADQHQGKETGGMAGMGMLNHGARDGYVISADFKQHCGTCEFWGGPRRIAENGKTLTITGLGWCNNPASPNYQKMTSPDHGPMSTWKKWMVLG